MPCGERDKDFEDEDNASNDERHSARKESSRNYPRSYNRKEDKSTEEDSEPESDRVESRFSTKEYSAREENNSASSEYDDSDYHEPEEVEKNKHKSRDNSEEKKSRKNKDDHNNSKSKKKSKSSKQRAIGFSDDDHSCKQEVNSARSEKEVASTERKENNKNNKSPGNKRSQSDTRRPKPPVSNRKHNSTGNQNNRGRGRDRGQPRSHDDRSIIVDRVLSANRNKSRALHNVISELQQHVDTLTIENKDLKRAARLQDREIRKLDNAEAELPFLLTKHNNEMRVVQETFRRQKEASDKSRETLKKRDEELYRTKEKLRKYEAMTKEKNLGERSSLNKRLQELERVSEEKDTKIAELTRAVQLHEKVRARELKEKNEKYKKAVEEMRRLESEQRELLRRLKEKEKALEVTNIYSQRMQGRRGSKGSDDSTRIFSPTDPVPTVIKRHQEEQENQYEDSMQKAFLTENNSTKNSVKGSTTSEVVHSKMVTMDFEDNDSNRTEKKKMAEVDLPRHKPVKTLVSENKSQQNDINDEEFFGLEEKSEEEKRLEEVDRKLAEMKRREELEKKKEEQERLDYEKEIEERVARREMELKIKEEERVAKECLEREKAQRRRGEELERIQKQEQDDGMMERQRKKELLLAKMQAIDRGESPSNAHKYEAQAKPKKKPIFLESNTPPLKHKTEDNILDHEPLDFSAKATKPTAVRRRNTNEGFSSNNSSRRNSWDFKKTDENLHKGFPAHTIAPERRTRKNSDERTQSPVTSGKSRYHNDKNNDDIGRYSPTTFNNSPRSQNKSNKKHTSPFDEFEDPFKTNNNKMQPSKDLKFSSDEEEDDIPVYQPSSTVNKNNTNKAKPSKDLNFSSDEEENDIPVYQPSKVNHAPKQSQYSHHSKRMTNDVDDDLEEIDI